MLLVLVRAEGSMAASYVLQQQYPVVLDLDVVGWLVFGVLEAESVVVRRVYLSAPYVLSSVLAS